MSQVKLLRILLIGPGSLELIGGTTVSFNHLREALESRRDVAIEVLDSVGIRGAGWKSPWRLLRFLAALTTAAFRHDVLTLHAMPTGLPYMGWYVLAVARLSGRPLIYRAFGGMYYHELPWPRRWLARILMRGADVVLLQTRELMAEASRDYLRRVEWFPTARPMPQCVARRRGPCRRFVYIGQLKVRKGLQILARVAERLPPDASVDVYGPWYDLPRDTFQSHHRIRYMRELRPAEVAPILESYDALVLPSFLAEEGYAGIIPEAYGAGLPVITTRWKALPEMVAEGVSGLLVAPRDENQLFHAMMQLYDSSALYARLCDGTETMRRQFSQENQANHFVDLCHRVVDRDRPPRRVR